MEQSNKDLCFFLGANSTAGFYSFFDQIYDPQDGWRGYIIKGGNGAGGGRASSRLDLLFLRFGFP